MYIGAWTEYRLAQEQAQLRRQQDAGQQPLVGARRGGASSTRRGAGIYHPSLSNKGGMAVAELPDRESFRRTLESTLSSNLTADDAENISQALEPLMQRLPTIHAPPTATPPRAAAAASRPVLVMTPPPVSQSRRYRRKTLRSMGRLMQPLYRQQKRKCGVHNTWENLTGRCGGGSARCTQTRSDAGTRSLIEPTLDGTCSTQSGFSAASLPLNTGAGLDGNGPRCLRLECGNSSCKIGRVDLLGQRLRGTRGVGSRGPQLPLIIDTRRRRRNAHCSRSGSFCDKCHCEHSARSSYQSSSESGNPTEICRRRDERNTSEGSNNFNTPARVIKDDNPCKEQSTTARGGYDGGAAATILRVARRRDPASINTNFEQFWTWKRAPAAAAGSQSTQDQISCRFTERKERLEKNTGVETGSTGAASKLQALSKMRTVYMTKEDNGKYGGWTPSQTAPSSPFEHTHPSTSPSEPCPRDCTDGTTLDGMDTRIARSPAVPCSPSHLALGEITVDETDLTKNKNPGYAKGWTSSDEDGMAKLPHDDVAADSNGTNHCVDIPDLELTESRIRQVDKYFGGSGCAGRYRPPPGQDTNLGGCLRVVEPEGSNSERGGYLDGAVAGTIAVENRRGTLPMVLNVRDVVGECIGTGNSVGGVGDREVVHGGAEEGAFIHHGTDAETLGGRESDEYGVPVVNVRVSAIATVNPERQEQRSLETECSDDGIREGGKKTSDYTRMSESGEPLRDARATAAPLPTGGSHKHETERPASEQGNTCEGVGSRLIHSGTGSPAWCTDSSTNTLEDLVCWTRGLDYEAAVKGY